MTGSLLLTASTRLQCIQYIKNISIKWFFQTNKTLWPYFLMLHNVPLSHKNHERASRYQFQHSFQWPFVRVCPCILFKEIKDSNSLRNIPPSNVWDFHRLNTRIPLTVFQGQQKRESVRECAQSLLKKESTNTHTYLFQSGSPDTCVYYLILPKNRHSSLPKRHGQNHSFA